MVTSVRGKISHNKRRKRTKFSFSSDGNPGVTYQCKLDDGKFKECEFIANINSYRTTCKSVQPAKCVESVTFNLYNSFVQIIAI